MAKKTTEKQEKTRLRRNWPVNDRMINDHSCNIDEFSQRDEPNRRQYEEPA
jgi:hypothetical protein